MNRRATLLLLFAALAPGLAAPTQAAKNVNPNPGAPGTWRLIGQVQASHGNDHDTIVVSGINQFPQVRCASLRSDPGGLYF